MFFFFFVTKEANFTISFDLIFFGFDSLVQLLKITMVFDQAGQKPEINKNSNSEELINSSRNFIQWEIHYWSQIMQTCFMRV